MTSFAVVLRGGSPWGFRITGGREFNEPITISKINPNSKAYNEGVKVGDVISEINGQKTHGLNYADAQQLIKNSTEQLLLQICRGDKPPNLQLNGGVPGSSIPPKPQKVDTESHWSERGSFEQPAAPTPPPPAGMWSKRPIMPPALPKPQKQNVKPLALYEPSQPVVSGYGAAQGFSPTSPHSQTLGRSSSVGRGSSSPYDPKSRGMNLFRRQQEKLAKLGADMQEINVSEPGFGHRPFEPPQAYSAQSSPGGINPYTATRSFSVDEGTRNVPIIVRTSRQSAPQQQPFPPRPQQRTRSNSESIDSVYHVRPAHEQQKRPVHDSGFSSWQSGLSDHSHGSGRNFGVGSYATLPAKTSASSHHHHNQAPQQQQRRQNHQQQQPPAALASSGEGSRSVPVTQPLSVDADQPINDFDYHIYSTLPTIKPLRSSHLRGGPLDLPELEREKKFQDFSQPLWTNTDLPGSAPGARRDDSHSPPSDNAVSSSDSRDTIIARSDETRSSHTDSTTKAEQPPSLLPKMIPVRVVHEDSGRMHRSPAQDSEMSDQPWGKRVVEGADQTFPSVPSEPTSSLHDKSSEHQINGLKSPGFSSSTKPGIWSPGVSPSSSVKSEPVGKTRTPSSPPGNSLKNIPSVWKPSGSPGGVRKEYRPVRLNTSARPAERKTQQEPPPPLKPEESYAWQPRRTSSTSSEPQVGGFGSGAPVSSLKYTPMSTASGTLFSDSRPATVSQTADSSSSRGGGGGANMAGGDHSRTNGSVVSDSVFDSAKDDEVRLPSTQSPYITLLQKSRENETQGDLNFSHIGTKKPIMLSSEGHLPRGAQYLGEKVTIEGDQQHTDTYYATPSQEVTTTTRKVEQKPKVYDGIGPLDQEGVPLAFRKNVQEDKQHDWYKQMYKSLHKKDKKEDRLGINDMIDSIFEKAEENTYRPTYKFPDDISDTKSEEDFNPYRPAYERSISAKADESGYRSEPEGRYKDLFRRHRTTSEREPRESRRNVGSYWSPASVKSKIEVYRNQPRSIMDYEPGFSSIAFREAKTRRPRSYSAHSLRERKRKNKGNQFNPPIDKPGQLSQYSLGGARSPSEPDVRQDGDGADPRDIYKRVQCGGDIPAKGLQKPAPEKPREEPAHPPPPSHPQSQSSSLPNSSATFPRKHAARQQAQGSGGSPMGSTPTPRTPFTSAPAPPTRGGSGGGALQGAGTLPLPRSAKTFPSRGASLSAAEQLGVKSPPPALKSPPPASPVATAGFVSGVSGNSGTAAGTSNLILPSATAAFKHQTSDERERRLRQEPIDPEKERRRKEEEQAYRKKRLEELYEEERLKKMRKDEADAEARRHHDFYTNAQKSPISPNRFDDSTPSSLSPSQPGSLGTLERKGGPPLSVPPERRRGFQIQGKARALFNFTAQNPRELPFRKNDIIFLLRQVDKNWFEGERHGRVGIFPTNYVEVVTSIEAAQAAAMQAEGQGRAKYSFTAQSTVELSLRKGEFVVLLRRVDENWYEGRIGNRQGIFPVSYVEIMREPSTPLITPAPSVITTPMTGTPEMLSPVGYDPAPTPPPQPSPSALLAHRSPYSYHPQSQQPAGFSSHPGASGSLLTPATSVSRQHISLNRQEHDFGGPRSPVGAKSPVSPGKSSPGGRRVSPGPGSMSRLQVDIHSSGRPFANGPPPAAASSSASKVTDDDLALTRYRALYAYRPQNEDELELREGDEVFVMEKCDDGWFVGTSARSGCFGTFPGNYIQKI